ncbi:HdeD family acid-resistance protein [Dysgonomonas sp. BGC7]|uniref:HdeD family acid-resistance protein n=1 Tax=Dysgonomonas sp. BGC7 TaxID=1658008 RepID=UPI0006802B14|nr:HdeD family acid-resistance protein [Dysgonomonas sp. BGC7]MBD8387459.1 HdeD family acid-resistance protein [Dysgonomonas sp. BGC7]
MKNDLFYSVKQAVKYWWISPIIGVIAIILGVWCLGNPGATLSILGAFFIAGFLVSGIFEIVFSLSNMNTLKGWGWTLASGIIDLLFGLLLIAMPIGTIAVILFMVGFWVMFQAIWGIGTAIDLQRNGVKGWGWILAFAILTLILAFILISSPLFAAGFIIYLMSFALFCYGIMRIYYGFRMRTVHKELDDMEKE